MLYHSQVEMMNKTLLSYLARYSNRMGLEARE